MNLKEIQNEIIKFRDDRNWKQFHTLKDLMMGLNIECAELSELFLWKSDDEVSSIDRSKIEEEIADIFIFLNYISKHFDIDIEKAVQKKIEINNTKYPIDKSFGSNKKYNELQ